MRLRFAGFELDQARAQLRGPAGEILSLRPKTFALLRVFLAHAGRVLSKQELLEAVWPNTHVGDDSLFQCVRELRAALGDDERAMIRLVSGQGYLFTPEIAVEGLVRPDAVPLPDVPLPGTLVARGDSQRAGRSGPRRFGRAAMAGLILVGSVAVIGFGIFALSERRPPTIAVIPLTVADHGGGAATMATDVAMRLVDGLSRIAVIRVLDASAADRADLVLTGDLSRADGIWHARARLTRRGTGEVLWAAPVSVPADGADAELPNARLAAGIGHPLALRLDTVVIADRGATDTPNDSGKTAIEQASASIAQTSRERFAAAQAMLETALAGDPENVELAVAHAALQLRGIQMSWFSPAESRAAEDAAKATLERARRREPRSIPVLETSCRFLVATNAFTEGLVACARVLDFDPWDGQALYGIGLAQMQLGRFRDALATFEEADRFDTPASSRWTWKLGAGLANVLMDRNAEAVPWLEDSIAITPASGRSLMVLAAAYLRLGRLDDARTAMAKALALRPGSTADNVALPDKNAGADFVAASNRLRHDLVVAGLPER